MFWCASNVLGVSNILGVFRMFWGCLEYFGCFECFGGVSNVLPAAIFWMFWGVLDKLLHFNLNIRVCCEQLWVHLFWGGGVLHIWATVWNGRPMHFQGLNRVKISIRKVAGAWDCRHRVYAALVVPFRKTVQHLEAKIEDNFNSLAMSTYRRNLFGNNYLFGFIIWLIGIRVAIKVLMSCRRPQHN